MKMRAKKNVFAEKGCRKKIVPAASHCRKLKARKKYFAK